MDMRNESAMDGESSKGMNKHVVPVPHVPKTNNEQAPSADEVISDHQRLLERLELYYLEENEVKGDGNCQFGSLSDQLYGDPKLHELIREKVIEQLKSQPRLYENFVPMSYDEYLKKMSKVGEWGDHVTLQAAADRFGIRIFLITSFKDSFFIEILPRIQKSEKVLLLSFWAEIHYNSVYPKSDVPASRKGKDKKGSTSIQSKHAEDKHRSDESQTQHRKRLAWWEKYVPFLRQQAKPAKSLENNCRKEFGKDI
ncbi:OVARIAN TUMOR DOMAIN-containing deubiquitinating enzyme 9-like [Corylus avellana]|uniref:OVARIAN TUMOR DOMAIN-containing deubiquitinating enzyme 9-like n=1 Tax=Corylus avellana TaxID=13451 RepID=UPI00286D18E1|nr:OVARIAN TUMOR DOMAIN-containing deubiquitinating enzyme 9-like [Corylus avellana]